MKPFLPMTLAALLAATSAMATEVKIAFNGVNDPETNAEAAFIAGFAAALEGTGFEVSVFPSDTLGSERERFDQVAQGLLEINLATASTPYGMSPMMRGIALPFLFESPEEFDRVMAETDLVAQMNEPLSPNGVRLAGFTFVGMPLGIHNTSVPVTTMEDLQGLRLRALNAEQLAYIQALGASGTIVAWAEVPNAIQTGVADGYLNAPNSAIRTGHTEFLRHFTQANITPSTRIVLMSEDWYDMLSADEQAQIDAAVEAGIAANRAWIADWSTIVEDRHRAAGVTLSDLAEGERDRMVAATRPTWDDVMEADHLQAFLDALDAVRD
ncbi:TRAP transporter substrate-binding protein [Rhodobaculum claviforme]|uniref:C4-dicarboxylate ABC transporter substrate-binding protein n=1 Tax=Rhodobaculum claviforme TaxID=1549854 RepID=A0A934TIN2_9RHOB|nr:TRAP transporter substrate-binding protein [Rhodobaculum claviforme]MBK5926364.1 C4-dicarboxylate ABC transporter substrate-binding protein [Rhodobaculum claviforme]